MNSFKQQFNSLIFKLIILLLINTFLSVSKLGAQQLTDKNYLTKLYDSTKVLYQSGDYNGAIDGLNEILLLKGEMPNDIQPAYYKVFNRLGVIFKRQGNLSKAINYYNKALEFTDDDYILSVINGNIAMIYSLTGDYSKAIFYYESSLSILKKSDKVNKYHWIVNNYLNQGYTYYKSGQMNLALKKSLQSIQIAKKNQIKIAGNAYYNCGLIYQNLDSLDKANIYFKKAIESYKKEFGEKHYMTAMAYVNYAVFYSETGYFSKSEQLYQKAHKILIKMLGEKHPYTSLCVQNLGQLHYKKENYKQALHYYQQSLISKIYDFNDRSIYVNPWPDVFPDLDLIDILKAKAQAFEKLAELEDKEINLKTALSTLELTVGFIEQLRTGYLYESSKLQLASQEHDIYLSIINIANSLYEINGDGKYAEIAFKYAELSKYAVLRELKNEEAARGIAGVPDSLGNYERRLKEQIGSIRMQMEEESKQETPDRVKIDKWNEKIFSLTQELENLVEKLESGYPEYYKQKYNQEIVSINQLQQSIDKKEAILEYVLGDSSLYTFVVTQDTFLLLKQDTDSVFHSSLDFYKTVLHRDHTSNYRLYRNSAYNLYKKLIFPVEPLLQNKNLLIIPDDKMNFISFDVLVDKPYKSVDELYYREEPFLLKKYPIAYAYSATLYKNSLTALQNNRFKFLGIAPGYENSKDSLIHMPLGLKSVRKIALLMLGKSLTGEKATEQKFKEYSNKYDVIQLYAHGFEDTLNPANSKLILSEPDDSLNDSYLHAWEVYNLQINAKLVVLASCYSGGGKLSKGEGVLSLSRSFMYAGSESIVMSLWLAPQKATNNILNSFYLNLLKGMRKDEALRLAKLRYLEQTDPISAHPRFWAGIVINGNQKELYKNWYLKRLIYIISMIGVLFFLMKKRKSIAKLF